MKAAELTGLREFRIVDRETPPPGSGEDAGYVSLPWVSVVPISTITRKAESAIHHAAIPWSSDTSLPVWS